MHKTGPKEDDRLAVEGRAVGEDCVFNTAFVMGRQSCCFLGSRERLGWCAGRSLDVNNVHCTFQIHLKQGCYETKNVRKENTEWEKEQITIVNNGKPERRMKDMKMKTA